MNRKAVFIDRDDTIAKDVPYCRRPEDLELFDGIAESIKNLNNAGFLVIIITNQSGIARGYFTEETLNKIHEKLRRDLARNGARIDGIYYCPHHPENGCMCRKPKPGMILRAAEDFNIDLKQSYVIGDKPHDVELGEKVGCTVIQIDNYSRNKINFTDAVNIILEKERNYIEKNKSSNVPK
jgi:histidinol-phosphate phosphatase family protein